jgi:putative hemolysin
LTGILFLGGGLSLLISSVLSAAETSTFSVGAVSLRTLREEGFRRAEVLQKVRDRAASIRAATFLANILLNGLTIGSFVAAGTLMAGAVGAAVALPLGLVLILLLGEGLPRLLATRQAIRLALGLAPVLLLLASLVRPFLSPFLALESLFHRSNGDGPTSSEEREMRQLTELGQREGVVEPDEHALVERAFRMDELAAWDVMTPRVDIFAWSRDATLEEVVPLLQSVPHSRVPVYGSSIDDITGILYVREAYAAYVAGRGEARLSELSREPLFVPGSLPLPQLLRDFQSRRIHMGIVADEFGGTDGLVTLEDVLEELVGEIEDETDITEELFVRISRDELEADGTLELREVNDVFEVSLPHLEHRSLNGFILEEMGHVPEAGETLDWPGLRIEILEASETQVLRARLRKTALASAE